MSHSLSASHESLLQASEPVPTNIDKHGLGVDWEKVETQARESGRVTFKQLQNLSVMICKVENLSLDDGQYQIKIGIDQKSFVIGDLTVDGIGKTEYEPHNPWSLFHVTQCEAIKFKINAGDFRQAKDSFQLMTLMDELEDATQSDRDIIINNCNGGPAVKVSLRLLGWNNETRIHTMFSERDHMVNGLLKKGVASQETADKILEIDEAVKKVINAKNPCSFDENYDEFTSIVIEESISHGDIVCPADQVPRENVGQWFAKAMAFKLRAQHLWTNMVDRHYVAVNKLQASGRECVHNKLDDAYERITQVLYPLVASMEIHWQTAYTNDEQEGIAAVEAAELVYKLILEEIMAIRRAVSSAYHLSMKSASRFAEVESVVNVMPLARRSIVLQGMH